MEHNLEFDIQCITSILMFKFVPNRNLSKYLHIKMETLKCQQCFFETRWDFALKEHRKHDNNTDFHKYFNCSHILNEYKCTGSDLGPKSLQKSNEHSNVQYKSDNLYNSVNQPNHNVIQVVYYECSECPYKTTRRFGLKSHFEHVHAKNEIRHWIKCQYCDYKTVGACSLINMTKHVFRKHMTDDESNWFNCRFCTYKTKQQSNFIEHQRVKHKNVLKCPDCSYETRDEKSLMVHTKYKHNKSSEIIYNYAMVEFDKMGPSIETVESFKVIQCPYCDYKSFDLSTVKNHILYRHTPAEKIEWFRCDECDYKAKRRYDLERHKIRKHNSNLPIKWIKCNYCKFVTKNPLNLDRHEIVKHKAVIKCSECSFETRDKSDFNIHKRFKHNYDKRFRTDEEKYKFECTDCDYKTVELAQLAKHVHNRHTPQEQIKWLHCTLCNYKAKSNRNLVRHQNIHHKESRVK